MSLNALRQVCSEPYGFWLDSAMIDGRLGRASFWGADPFLVLRSKGASVDLVGRSRTYRCQADPFEVLRDLLREHEQTASGAPTFAGAVGYLAYDLKQHVERLPARAVDDLQLPDCYFGFYDRFTRFDPRSTVDGGQYALRRSPLSGAPRLPASTFSPQGYKQAVERALEYIFRGDIYQVNLSQRFQLPLADSPFDVYLRLRRMNPAPFAAYINLPEVQLLSASPERFLHFQPGSRRVETRPIKGTRPRGRTAREDRELAAELLGSEKDRAENVMIVDLERNDLGRVADVGSVRVRELAALEVLPTVFHLTSTVEARQREDRDVVDLLLATFPGGSITGAPKIRAMEIIDELEPTARSAYTGAIGYIGFNAAMDLNIAIRTILVKGNTAYFQAGGGIVADSDPEREYQETLHKARALLEATVGNEPGQAEEVGAHAVDLPQR
ncbi:MAG: aminodeoxychorismate synthase component I [Dehalococcoidia bacterium]